MKITAAGFIIYKIKKGNVKVLGLKALPEFRNRTGGTYDIPKGRIDPGESQLEAAHRELLEETGLRVKRILTQGPILESQLAVWVAEVDESCEVKIITNPVTGSTEHEGYEWMHIDKLQTTCLGYLEPIITKSKKIIHSYTDNKGILK